ncbi:hypothetical protein [Saccharothrix lopnurensis]|uniref:Uncharacterized protein n=1 Tax=Saccharothrix lopnurensis TaxID=1670621 RepID=A0ABW1P6E7_9PSEU
MIARRVRITAAERLPTHRVSGPELMLLLTAEADRTGDDRLRVQLDTLRQWRRRRGWTGPGYDPATVVEYITNRGTRGQRKTVPA